MQVLTLLSLVYAAILVLALAVSLILIALRLRRIARVLKAVGSELQQAAISSEPLSPHLELVQEAAETARENIGRTHRALGPITDPLGRLAEKLGVTELA